MSRVEEEVLRAEGVSFSYGPAPALSNVSLSVAKGECLAILGANGSGKSTLLKLLDGLIFPSAGCVFFEGRPITEEALKGEFLVRLRSGLGFLFPEPDVQLFCPTVFDELAFGPLQLGLGAEEAAKRAGDLLRMLGIEALRDRPPYSLSGGEKKKVAIASVLAINPGVLLLDEPTNGLDPRSQVWLYELLLSLRGHGKTVIIATHDLSLAGDLSERVLVLDESHAVAADGPAGEILKDKDLLLKANIIHEHEHRHGDVVHRHSHGPFSTHDEHD